MSSIDLTPVIELGWLLLAFYLTIGLMAVGFAIMLDGLRPASGKDGKARPRTAAGAVARLFFLRPLAVVVIGMLAALRWLRDKAWAGLRALLLTAWRMLRDFMLWPVARATLAVLRLAAVGFADTLHFLLTGRGR
jgi:hypothetical protein